MDGAIEIVLEETKKALDEVGRLGDMFWPDRAERIECIKNKLELRFVELDQIYKRMVTANLVLIKEMEIQMGRYRDEGQGHPYRKD